MIMIIKSPLLDVMFCTYYRTASTLYSNRNFASIIPKIYNFRNKNSSEDSGRKDIGQPSELKHRHQFSPRDQKISRHLSETTQGSLIGSIFRHYSDLSV